MQTVINKFKRVLKNWLFSKEMADIKNMQIKIEELIEKCGMIDDRYSELRHYEIALREAKRTLASCMEVGVDVHMKGGSWAVICLKGKPEYVKFIDLGHSNIMQISQFLRQFEDQHSTIDAGPYAYQIRMETDKFR